MGVLDTPEKEYQRPHLALTTGVPRGALCLFGVLPAEKLILPLLALPSGDCSEE